MTHSLVGHDGLAGGGIRLGGDLFHFLDEDRLAVEHEQQMTDDALVQANLAFDILDAIRLDLEVIEGVEAVTQIGAVVADRIRQAAPAPGGFVAAAQDAAAGGGDVARDGFGCLDQFLGSAVRNRIDINS